MFHFGGSTHCLLFRPDTELKFEPQVEGMLEGGKSKNLPVNSLLATVINASK